MFAEQNLCRFDWKLGAEVGDVVDVDHFMEAVSAPNVITNLSVVVARLDDANRALAAVKPQCFEWCHGMYLQVMVKIDDSTPMTPKLKIIAAR